MLYGQNEWDESKFNMPEQNESKINMPEQLEEFDQQNRL